MTHAPFARRQPRLTALAVTAAALVGASTGAGVAHAGVQHGGAGAGHHGAGCPAAESLVAHTTWHRHALAPGVVMTAGQTTDSRGVVNLHTLRVDLTRPRVQVRPLMHAVASRSPLSQLAQGHSAVVAATNTGYFDFRTGAPTLPVVSGRAAVVMSSAREPVVGLNAAGRVQSGSVWLSSTLVAGSHTAPIVAVNEVDPPTGIAEYNTRWGSSGVYARSGLVRAVVNGKLSDVQQGSRFGGVAVPSGGKLLVARGSGAVSALSAIPLHSAVTVRRVVDTSAAAPFVQAYGVGDQLVASGKALTGFTCDSSRTTQPARTAIGFANGGKRLVIGVVAQHPYTSEHGLDNDQMAAFMAQLGVTAAYDFDGSGSTELLARTRSSSSLRLQTYPADGAERPMPLGLGIAVMPVKHPATKRKHHTR
jgi:hypothetical protein